jgi:hypothetical protein
MNLKPQISLSLEFKLGIVKRLFPYTHASKTQEFNHKINVIPINLKANMGMNVSIHLHYEDE